MLLNNGVQLILCSFSFTYGLQYLVFTLCILKLLANFFNAISYNLEEELRLVDDVGSSCLNFFL